MLRRLLLALVCLSFTVPSARSAGGSFDSDGVRISYSVEGAGEPVVLVHGFSVNGALQWTVPGITKALARDHMVIVMDCRGHGLSGKPHDPGKYGVEMVEDIVRLLDHLKIPKAHVVGYSMGGFIALKLAALHPDRVLTVTTGGAGWSAKTNTGFLDDLIVALEQGKGISPLLIALTPKGQPKPTEEQLRGANQMVTLFNDSKALAALLRGRKGGELTEAELKGIRVPVLAIVGEVDPLRDGVDAMQGRVPDLKTVVVPGADHMNAFAQPGFIRALRDFLAKHTRAGDKAAADAAAGARP